MNKILKSILISVLILFIVINILAYFHVYKFTHFNDKDLKRTKQPEELSFPAKLKILFIGIDNPKPKAEVFPNKKYKNVIIKNHSNEKIACWHIAIKRPKGIVLLFHGYASEKSQLLNEAYAFNKMGYDTLLVDLPGHGDSYGYTTTLGYHEADGVNIVYKYIKKHMKYKNIILYGSSMGSVSIIRAVSEYNLDPSAIIMACPFASMYQAVKVRFKVINLPSFPLAEILMLWGSVQHQFWTFSHNTVEYAEKIKTPALLMYGLKDARVEKEEMIQIYNALKGSKQLKFFPQSGHVSYYITNPKEWMKSIQLFLKEV